MFLHSYFGECNNKGGDNTQLWLSEKIYKSDKISVYGLAAYCAIKTLLPNEDTKEICVTDEILAYQLTKSLNYSRRFYSNLQTGYNELLSNGFIKEVLTKSKHKILDCSNLFITEENDFFTIISYAELLKIFKEETTNSFLLLKYFVYLIGTISSTIDVYIDAVQHKCRVVGNLTIDYISKLSGISERSIIEYNKILENIGLIYIYRQNDFLLNENSGELKRLPNVYGRLEDKCYIDAFAENQKKYRKSYNYVENNIEKANVKRRLAQMYNQICKNNDSKYSEEEIQQVYMYVIHENHKYKSIYEKNNDESCLEKIRDTRVFEKYNFLTTKEE